MTPITSEEIMLKAARMAYPFDDPEEWDVDLNGVVFRVILEAPYHVVFNPHDPTKGDLAALNEALERAGWEFKFYHGWFCAAGNNTSVSELTIAERALKCVEVMP